MQLTRTVTVVEVIWVLVALLGLGYGIRVVRDAVKVLRVIRNEGDSKGLEEIAQLLVVTTSILVFVFLMFLCSAGLSMTIPTPAVVTPTEYILQAFFVSVEGALAYMLFYTHRIRQRVLRRDMADNELRAAAVELARVELEHNTVALEANTTATVAATLAMENGPVAAQLDATRAMDANTASRVSDAAALLLAAASRASEHDENTEALNLNTCATDRNTDRRDPNERTRRDDEEKSDG